MPYSQLCLGKRVLPTSQCFLLHHKAEMKQQDGMLGLRSLKSPRAEGGTPAQVSYMLILWREMVSAPSLSTQDDSPSEVAQASKHLSNTVVAVYDHISSPPLLSDSWEDYIPPLTLRHKPWLFDGLCQGKCERKSCVPPLGGSTDERGHALSSPAAVNPRTSCGDRMW